MWAADEAAHAADIGACASLCCMGGAHAWPGQGAAPRRGAVQGARKLDYLRLIPVEHDPKGGIDILVCPTIICAGATVLR